MFKFGKYTVLFKHIQHDAQWVEWADVNWHAETICLFMAEGEIGPVAHGIHLFLLPEPFNRKIGRKESFAKALSSFVPRDQRLLWWAEFAKNDSQWMGVLTERAKITPFAAGVHHE